MRLRALYRCQKFSYGRPWCYNILIGISAKETSYPPCKAFAIAC